MRALWLTCGLMAGVGCSSSPDPKAYDDGEEVPLSEAMLATYTAERSYDASSVITLWETGCSNGDVMGCARLGMHYRLGRDVPKDLTKAEPLLDRGCRGQVGAACTDLALIRNDPELHRRGCKLGDPFGCAAGGLDRADSPDMRSKADQEAMRLAALVVEEYRGWGFKGPVTQRPCVKEVTDTMRFPGWRKQLENYQAVLRAAHLAPKDYDIIEEIDKDEDDEDDNSSVLGLYLDDVIALCEETKGKKRSRGQMLITLVHELTHALDDDHFEFKKMREEGDVGTNGDLALVIKSLIEGSASTVEREFYSRASGTGRVHSGELRRRHEDEQKEAEEDQVPAPYWVSSTSYYYGERFLARGAWADNWSEKDGVYHVDPKDVRRAFKDPPLSMEQILHPHKYWTPAARDDPQWVRVEMVTKGLHRLGWRVLAHDTLGELLLRVWVESPDLKKDKIGLAVYGYGENVRAAEGWDGDEFFVLEGEGRSKQKQKQKEGVRAGLWLSVWDSPGDRAEFEEAFSKAHPEAKLVAIGKRQLAVLMDVPEKKRKPLVRYLEKAKGLFTDESPFNQGRKSATRKR